MEDSERQHQQEEEDERVAGDVDDEDDDDFADFAHAPAPLASDPLPAARPAASESTQAVGEENFADFQNFVPSATPEPESGAAAGAPAFLTSFTTIDHKVQSAFRIHIDDEDSRSDQVVEPEAIVRQDGTSATAAVIADSLITSV